MDAMQVEEILSDTRLTDSARQRIRESTNKTIAYTSEMTWARLNVANRSLFRFRRCIANSRIFLTSEIGVKLLKMEDLLSSSLLDRIMHEQHGRSRVDDELDFFTRAWKRISDEAGGLESSIERLAQQRLKHDAA
jgi:hypothetical protein